MRPLPDARISPFRGQASGAQLSRRKDSFFSERHSAHRWKNSRRAPRTTRKPVRLRGALAAALAGVV
eukprot:tig00021238_g19548.t1